MHERIRDALLGRWGRTVTVWPRTTLALCLALAAASIVLTALRLEFRPDRSDLVEENLSWNRRYAEYKAQFERWDDVLVCIDGPADDRRVDALARSVAERLEANPRVVSADAGFPISQVGPRLFTVAPEPVFAQVLDQIRLARRLTGADNANAALAAALQGLDERSEETGSLDQLESLLEPYLDALEGRAPDFAFLRPDPDAWQPLVSETGSGRIRFVQVQLASAGNGVDEEGDLIQWLRTELAAAVAGFEGPDVEWGVTGIAAIEADETKQSMRDSTVASVLALVLITTLMLVVFRGVVVPLLAAGSLLVGVAWSFGWLIISVGHLQLLSVVFSVILLGLGIDFALHLVSRLELIQDEHAALPFAIARVFRGIGPGMLTGAITTAAAFGATTLTQFKGMAEMGIIAGGGIILCLVAMLSAFPAALALTGRWKQIIRSRRGGESAHFAHGRLDGIDFRPKRAIAVAAVVVSLLVLAALQIRYDPNVLNLHAPEVESVEWERRMVEDDARTVWAALIETAPDKAAGLVDLLRGLPVISDVGGMGFLFPADRVERAARVAEMRAEEPTPPAVSTGAGPLLTQLASVQQGLSRRVRTTDDATARRLGAIANDLRSALGRASRLPEVEREQRWTMLDRAYRAARDELRPWLEEALAPQPVTAADLPKVLREQWSVDATWLLRVYPADDPEGRSILDPDRLGDFVETIAAVDASVFGPPVQIYESSKLIVREYTKAACYAVAAILVLLLLDFRSLADALCAFVPVFVGFVGVFGMMGLFGVPLNFANIIVMPLIFGIGVDTGVHMVHRWRDEPYGRPAGLSGGTGRGITLTMTTTVIGFGCMLLAEHRGIRSLGFVMVVGLAVTLLACYFVLPAILRLRTTKPGLTG